jgi:hypothetical protein
MVRQRGDLLSGQWPPPYPSGSALALAPLEITIKHHLIFYLGLQGIKRQKRRSASKTTEELSHAPSSIRRPLGFSFSLNRVRVACRRRAGPLLPARTPLGLSWQLPVLKP